MQVIIYTRVSTSDQKENGFSLQDQERKLREHCRLKGKEVVGHYQDDFSAKTFDRPDFQRMLSDIRNGKIKAQELWCVRWDRFSRDLHHSLDMKKELKALGLEVHFIENDLDWSIPENLLAILINMAIPQVENERRALNTKTGMRQALRQGRWVWKAPKGYLNDTVTKTIVKSDDAHFVKKAFNEVAAGIRPVEEVRRELVKSGFECSKQQFYNLLRNVFYYGKIKIEAWKDEPEQIVPGIHQPIISEELFQRVQAVLYGRNRKSAKPAKYNDAFPLRGHLICYACGSNLTASRSRSRNGDYYEYYHCQHGCKERHSGSTVNNTFSAFLDDFSVDSGIAALYVEIVADVFREKDGSRDSQLQHLNRQKVKVEEKLKDADDLLLSGGITLDDYKRMGNNLKGDLERIEHEKRTVERTETNLDKYFHQGVTMLTDLKDRYQEASLHLKHKIIGSIFPEKLIFDGENYRTTKINSFVELISSNSAVLKKGGKKKATIAGGLSNLAPPLGDEPNYLNIP